MIYNSVLVKPLLYCRIYYSVLVPYCSIYYSVMVKSVLYYRIYYSVLVLYCRIYNSVLVKPCCTAGFITVTGETHVVLQDFLKCTGTVLQDLLQCTSTVLQDLLQCTNPVLQDLLQCTGQTHAVLQDLLHSVLVPYCRIYYSVLCCTIYEILFLGQDQS